MMIEISARLIATPAESEEFYIVGRLLACAQDWANVSHAERSRWLIEYLYGKYYIKSGNHEHATLAFTEAILALTRRLRNAEQVAWRGSVLTDIAASSRKYELEIDRDAIHGLPSRAVQTQMLEILAMNEDDFSRFDKERRRDALFRHEDYVIEAP